MSTRELDRRERRLFGKAFDVLCQIAGKRDAPQKWVAIQLLVEPGTSTDVSWFFAHNGLDRDALRQFGRAFAGWVELQIAKESGAVPPMPDDVRVIDSALYIDTATGQKWRYENGAWHARVDAPPLPGKLAHLVARHDAIAAGDEPPPWPGGPE